MPTPQPPASPEASQTSAPPEPIWGAATPAVALAMTDLSRKLGVTADAIKIVRIEHVTWRDASLGCARPGRMYAQVLVPGHLIVLEVAGRTFEYHAGESRVILCEGRTSRRIKLDVPGTSQTQ